MIERYIWPWEAVRKTDNEVRMTKAKRYLTDLQKLAHELGVAKIVFSSTPYGDAFGKYLEPGLYDSGLAREWGLTQNMHGRITTQTCTHERAVILLDVKWPKASLVPHILAHELGHHCFQLAYGSCQWYAYCQKPSAQLLSACVKSGLIRDTSSVEEIVAETFANYLEGKLTFNRVLDAKIAEVLQRMPAKARRLVISFAAVRKTDETGRARGLS
jgi:hypothetical protein